MRKTNEKNNKGITLIALIITIIVMLILVSVTIAMAVNGGLFDYAKKASSETKNATKDEQWLANGGIQIGDVYYSIDDYLSQVSENNGSRIKLSYKVTPAEDRLSAVITVNARMLGGLIKGFEEYETWALKKLEGKTEEEIEQIFVDGHNFLAHAYGTMPTVNDMEEYISVIGTDFANGAFSDVEGMLEFFGEMRCGDAEYFKSLGELAIDMLQVYPAEYEYWDDYYMWAKIQLRGKTNEEIEQIFVDGQNYWIEVNEIGIPEFKDIDDLVDFILDNDSENYPECEDIYDIANADGYDTLADMAIDGRSVYPEKWAEQEGKRYDNIIHIMDPSGETWWETNTVEYTVYGDGEYTFNAINETGTESNSITVKLDIFGYGMLGSNGEKFSKLYNKTETYIDKNKDRAIIPKGFSVGVSDGINTVKNGLVIRDEKGNEFVWIPVTGSKLNGWYSVSNGYYYEPAALQKSTTVNGPWLDSQQLVDDLYGKNCYKVTQTMYAEEYAIMVESVNDNEGFYIGRYETTRDSDGSIGSKYDTKVVTANMMYEKNSRNCTYLWYGLYHEQKTANVTGNGIDIQTAMIYGVLWDKTMEFIGEQFDKGNSNAYDVDAVHSEWHDTSMGILNSAQANTGATKDVALNIWDLEGNCAEYTQEAHKNKLHRIYRGRSTHASGRSNELLPTEAAKWVGSRLILYIL